MAKKRVRRKKVKCKFGRLKSPRGRKVCKSRPKGGAKRGKRKTAKRGRKAACLKRGKHNKCLKRAGSKRRKR